MPRRSPASPQSVTPVLEEDRGREFHPLRVRCCPPARSRSCHRGEPRCRASASAGDGTALCATFGAYDVEAEPRGSVEWRRQLLVGAAVEHRAPERNPRRAAPSEGEAGSAPAGTRTRSCRSTGEPLPDRTAFRLTTRPAVPPPADAGSVVIPAAVHTDSGAGREDRGAVDGDGAVAIGLGGRCRARQTRRNAPRSTAVLSTGSMRHRHRERGIAGDADRVGHAQRDVLPSTVNASRVPSASATRRSASSRLSDPRETARATRQASLVPDARFWASMTWIRAAPAIVVTVSATSSSTSVRPERPSAARGITAR